MKYEYGNAEYEGNDFYCYPGTNILANIFGIQDGDYLHEVEREISYGKLLKLKKEPLKGTLNLKYLQKIHKYVFEDIYTWAGRIRGGVFFLKGNTEFCRADKILMYADDIFGKLKSENWLRKLCHADFIKRMAYYMGEVNALHPFREGNGRTQRIFFEELARRARYELDFSVMNSDELLEADIAAYNKEYGLLIGLLGKGVNVL